MEVVDNIIHAFIWAVIVMMFDFSMNKGQINNWYYRLIKKLNGKHRNKAQKYAYKILGGCIICFGFWFSVPMYFVFDSSDYLVFVSVSQFILLLRYGN